ncbi:hypothetical protein [Staphylococcus equorum]|uniref:hypothetical protein n=1 Tax=Staphylococcus equorum TaxID=246432 RepID=UPI000B0534B0|nr:hypothetical protein [Staphylococcus equorum]MDK9870161.1 hypothetical protein [Staphylococcus equorum]
MLTKEKDKIMLNNIIATPTVIAAIIGSLLVLIGNKIISTLKMKSEIEDSRIEWIKNVRQVNINLIKAFYNFISEQNFYNEKMHDIDQSSEIRGILLEGLVYESNKENNNVELYEAKISNLEKTIKEQSILLNNKKIERTKAMYNILASIEEMKNLFPKNKYKIKKRKIKVKERFKNKYVLVANEIHDIVPASDKSISNIDICHALDELKQKIEQSYKNNEELYESELSNYTALINDYLKIEWEKVKARKSYNKTIL